MLADKLLPKGIVGKSGTTYGMGRQGVVGKPSLFEKVREKIRGGVAALKALAGEVGGNVRKKDHIASLKRSSPGGPWIRTEQAGTLQRREMSEDMPAYLFNLLGAAGAYLSGTTPEYQARKGGQWKALRGFEKGAGFKRNASASVVDSHLGKSHDADLMGSKPNKDGKRIYAGLAGKNYEPHLSKDLRAYSTVHKGPGFLSKLKDAAKMMLGRRIVRASEYGYALSEIMDSRKFYTHPFVAGYFGPNADAYYGPKTKEESIMRWGTKQADGTTKWSPKYTTVNRGTLLASRLPSASGYVHGTGSSSAGKKPGSLSPTFYDSKTHEGKKAILRNKLDDLKAIPAKIKGSVAEAKKYYADNKEEIHKQIKQQIRSGAAEGLAGGLHPFIGAPGAAALHAVIDPEGTNKTADAVQELVGKASPRAEREMKGLRTGYHASITSPINARVNRLKSAVSKEMIQPAAEKVKNVLGKILRKGH